MKRVLAATLALNVLLAPMVEAGRLLVVVNPVVSGSEANHRNAVSLAIGALDRFGVPYDVIPFNSAKTQFCRIGVQTWDLGAASARTTSYDAVLHLGFRRGSNSYSSGYLPESLMIAAGWPSVPQIFLTDLAMNNNWTDAVYSGSAGCSTGVRAGNPYASGSVATHAQYLVGQPEVWHGEGISGGTGGIPAGQSGANAAWYARGIWRPIVGVGASASSYADAGNGANTRGCFDCDSLGRSTSPDTVQLWARYRSRTDTAPLIFCQMGGTTASAEPMLFAMALAMADSLSGGDLIQKQIKTAFVIDGMYRPVYGTSAATSYAVFTSLDTMALGFLARPDSTDTLNVAASMDSLNSLNVPITFTVDAESIAVASMSYHKRLIERVKHRRIVVNSYTGTTLQPDVRATERYKLFDIFGHVRARQVLPAGATDVPATCADTDTQSVYCLYRWAIARAESIFGDRYVDRTLVPAYGDWTPTTVTRANTSVADSLMWALGSFGVKGSVASLYSPDNSASRSTQPRGPLGFRDQYAVWNVKKPGVSGAASTGRWKNMPSRGSDIYTIADPWCYGTGGMHRLRGAEEWTGIFRNVWYVPHTLHATHMQQTRLSVFRYSAALLGGSGPGTRPSRHAWWWIKHSANQISAVNKLAGRTVIKATTLDEVAAEP